MVLRGRADISTFLFVLFVQRVENFQSISSPLIDECVSNVLINQIEMKNYDNKVEWENYTH